MFRQFLIRNILIDFGEIAISTGKILFRDFINQNNI